VNGRRPSAKSQDGRQRVCGRCGSSDLDVADGKGPHKASIVCRSCGRFVGWVGFPIVADEAATFVMPFGRHKGAPLGELPRDYLSWLATNIRGRIAERARVLLGDREVR
jgi:hypothetical protein